MGGNELRQDRKLARWKRKLQQFFGPWGIFFLGFLKHPSMVSSIIPSSRFTVQSMLKPVDWSQCKLFVEYGPGVGTFCRPILDQLPRDGTLIVIDTNRDFIDFLRRSINDSRFVAVFGSAEDVEQIIRAHGHSQADYILSGLPFSTLPAKVADRIATATHDVIRPGGAFLTYQMSNTAHDLTAKHFDTVESKMEWLNVPPCKLVWGWKSKG